MYNKHFIALAISCLTATRLLGAPGEKTQAASDIVISADSVRIGDVSLLPAPKQGTPQFFSLSATEKALGQPTDKYPAGLGVLVYSWRDLGIHLQRGWRGPEKGKWFKFQVYLHDDIDRTEHKQTNKFPGHIQLDGIDLSADAKFDGIRGNLEKQGYTIKTEGGISVAEKGSTQIFTVTPSEGSRANATNEIERVEVWSNQ